MKIVNQNYVCGFHLETMENRNYMKLVLYVAGGFVGIALAGILITAGRAPDSNPFMLFAFVALFGIPPLGMFWMMYTSIRFEKNPFPLVLLALIPFTFLWYYFERVRPGKLKKNRDFV